MTTTTIVTTKGQVVIPSLIRKHLDLREGTRLSVIESGDKIVLQPLTADYFRKMAGILKTRGKLTQSLLQSRAMERSRENKRR